MAGLVCGFVDGAASLSAGRPFVVVSSVFAFVSTHSVFIETAASFCIPLTNAHWLVGARLPPLMHGVLGESARARD